jgi:hypothetical protein
MSRFLKFFDNNKTPRQVQIDALNWLDAHWDNGKAKVLSMPVGSGKSAIARAISRYNEAKFLNTAINTCTNILVDQYAADYPEVNTLKGASNYNCCTADGYNCEERRLLQKSAGRLVSELDCFQSCEYVEARRRVYRDKVTFYNPMSYSFVPKRLVNAEKKVVRDATPNTLIVDEFHNLASMLRGQFEVVLWQDDVDWKTGVSGNVMSVLEVLRERIEIVKDLISPSMAEKKRMLLDRELQRLVNVIGLVLKQPMLFVAEEKLERKYNKMMRQLSLRPVFVPEEVVRDFFVGHQNEKVKNIVLMSGTAFEHHWKELGFASVDFFDCASPIPKERRQVVVKSSFKNSFKVDQTLLLEKMAKEIKQIAAKHSTESGIVLATYKQAEELRAYLTEDIYMFHDKENKANIIKEFVESVGKRKIAVLAGSWEGLDLKGDISRFTIVTKLPFGNLSDKVVVRRKDIDTATGKGLWYSLEAMQYVMQGSGRSTRGPEDFSTTYVLDNSFVRVYAQCALQLPKWFKESLVF